MSRLVFFPRMFVQNYAQQTSNKYNDLQLEWSCLHASMLRSSSSICLCLILLVIKWSSEKHDMGLGSVDGIVNPASGLLHSYSSPFNLCPPTKSIIKLII